MIEWTGRERVLAALRRQEPDRVPFVEVSVDRPVAYAALGRQAPVGPPPAPDAAEQYIVMGGTFGTPAEGDLELARGLGLDGLAIHFWAPNLRAERMVDGHSMMVGGTIATRRDLERVVLHDPDDPLLYEPYRRFIERYRDSGLALICMLNLGSDPTIQAMGLETFSLALYDDRPFVEELFDRYADWHARAVRRLCALGFDLLWFGDDIAFKSAPFVSPRVFREVFMPRFRRVVEGVTLPWVFHSDGNVMPLLDDLLSLGMCGLHPLEPGAMNLVDLKRRYGDRICLCGHISVDTLGRGTPSEVEVLVRDAMRVAAPGGGYIVGSSNSIPWYARPENVAALATAVRKYGKYPIGG